MAKIKKAKFKFTKELAILLSCVLVLAIATILLALPTAKERIVKEYASVSVTLDAEHVFKKVSIDKAEKLINGESDYVFVYFGAPSCTNCQTAITVFNSQAKAFDVDVVYYIDSAFTDDYDREKNADDDNYLTSLEEKLKGVNLNDTPGLWVYKDGNLVFNSGDYANVEDETLKLTWKGIANNAFQFGYAERKN